MVFQQKLSKRSKNDWLNHPLLIISKETPSPSTLSDSVTFPISACRSASFKLCDIYRERNVQTQHPEARFDFGVLDIVMIWVHYILKRRSMGVFTCAVCHMLCVHMLCVHVCGVSFFRHACNTCDPVVLLLLCPVTGAAPLLILLDVILQCSSRLSPESNCRLTQIARSIFCLPGCVWDYSFFRNRDQESEQ